MDQQEAFETIKQARVAVNSIIGRRENLATYTDKLPSASTVTSYQREFKRLTEGTTSPSEIITRAKQTGSVRTWYRRRAALLYTYLNALEKMLTDQDKLQREIKESSDWFYLVKNIKNVMVLLNLIENEPSLEESIRKSARSKKKDLYGLPDEWRQIIIARMPTYQAQMLTLAITGCRPIELKKDVFWKIDQDKIVAIIQGAKISKFAGQKTRSLTFPIVGELANAMQKIIIENGGEVIVSVNSTVNLTTSIRSAAKRAFPNFKKTVTACSFRHQASSDWKADANTSGNTEENLILVSGMLGHATNLTKGRYGHSSQGRGSLVPEKVETSRPVKVIQKISYVKSANNKPYRT